MPWSFVSHIERVLNACHAAGFECEIPVSRLRTEIMRVSGVTNHVKLAEYIRVMIELGYARMKGDFVVEFSLSYALPYEFVNHKVEPVPASVVVVEDGKSKE